MIRINNSEAWTNDLVSIQIYNDAGSIKVDLDAPAAESSAALEAPAIPTR